MSAFNKFGSNIDLDFINIDYEIDGKNFGANLSKFLIAKRVKNNEIEVEEIEFLLESCAAMREFFLAGYLEIKDKRELSEEEFEIDYATWEEEARKSILDQRVATTGKPISSTTINVSKDEIKNYIIRKYEDGYRKHTEEIRKSKKAESFLYETYKNFYQRAMELQSIFKAKQPNNFNGEIHRSM